MEIEKNAENAKKFKCHTCDFLCCKQSEYTRHLYTRKHVLRNNGNALEIKKTPKNAKSYLCDCGKTYKTYPGLWKHSKTCNYNNDMSDVSNNILENTIYQTTTETLNHNMFMTLINENQELKKFMIEQVKETNEFKSIMLELIKSGINNTTNLTNTTNLNSHNKSFNLNFFLNETCKDAMNITDFMHSVELQLSDLENVGEVGFINGISDIIVNNLKRLDISKRPVHCIDAKREVLYVKDENKWEKEGEENAKLRKAIKHVAHKNSKMLPEFRKNHPDCVKSESKYSDQYNKLVIEAMGGKGDNEKEKEDKIIKKIAKEMVVQK